MLPGGRKWLQLLVVLLAGATMSVARAGDADGDDIPRANPARMAQAAVLFRRECSDCHIAYPPSMLPTLSWRNIMTTLDNHYGSDASLSDRETDEITAHLADNSIDGWGIEVAPLRITETKWFRRKHHYVVPSETWDRPDVKSPANCPACHKQAQIGEFSERSLDMPE